MNSGILMHPLVQLFLARFREFLRTPEAVFWSYVFPLVMMVALGLAFRTGDVPPVNVAIAQGTAEDQLAKVLEQRGGFEIIRGSNDDCRTALRSGKADVLVQLPESDQPTRFQYDAARPGGRDARNAVNNALQAEAGRQDPLQTEDVTATEPGGRYIDFLVPGLIGMGLMGGGVWGVGYAIVDMRIRRVLRRMLGTPMKKHHFIAAMMASRLVFMIPEIIVILILGWLMFGVVSYGGYLAVAMIVVLGAVEFSCIGLIIASRARTLEAVAGLMNLTMVPMWVGSGIFFSSERFPDLVQPLIRLLPLTPVISSLRLVMQEAAGPADILPQLAIMAGWAAVTFLTAVRIFRWD